VADHTFERYVAEALAQPFSGWDFSYLRGRMVEEKPDWDYAAMIRGRLAAAGPALDLGTGGGEFLASLAPPPSGMVATEAYVPNVPLARARLEPLGVTVVQVEGAPDNVNIVPGTGLNSLPFADERFSLVINRHESYYPAEVFRILQPGGAFITQQVGGEYLQDLNRALGAPHGNDGRWNLAFAVGQLQEAGFQISEAQEAFPTVTFSDIGAVVYYLRAAPWQIPDFTFEGYREWLVTLHERIVRDGGLQTTGHLFYVEARRLPLSGQASIL
jgi:SAM-dependent methyltransferase